MSIIKFLCLTLFLCLYTIFSYARVSINAVKTHAATHNSSDSYTPHNSSSDAAPIHKISNDNPGHTSKKARQKKMNEDLARVKRSYDEFILTGKPDPYPRLIADPSRRIIPGPKGSNLFVLVKTKKAGGKISSTKEINSELVKNTEIQGAIRENLNSGDKLIIDESEIRSPKIQKLDGSIIQLKWHRNPNHTDSISLINASSLPANTRQEKMNMELIRVSQNYDEIILKGKQDPYPKLMMDSSKKIIAGPEGSNLLAMVKIKNSGDGRYYAKEAKSELIKSAEVQEAIRRSLDPGDQLIIDNSGNSNPKIQKSDGSIVKLEWHHSPNHIGSISLIKIDAHRLAGNKGKLHYEKQKGGNQMYNTQY